MELEEIKQRHRQAVDNLATMPLVPYEAGEALRQFVNLDCLELISEVERLRNAGKRLCNLDLEPIKAREQAAIPGPWLPMYGGEPNLVSAPRDSGRDVIAVVHEPSHDGRSPDADFIAHAREDVPALIAEVEQLRSALGKCHDYFSGLRRDELPGIIVECKRALGR